MKQTENYNFSLYEPNDLADLTDGYNNSMELLDTDLKAVSGAVEAYDTRITANATAIDAETTRATEAERTNTSSINAEIERAKAAEQVNADAIEAEAARAKAAESKLGGGDSTYLFMGDSWAAINDNQDHLNYAAWARTLCNNYSNIYSFAHGGYTTTQFKSEIAEAAASTDFSNDSVKRILLVGGINNSNLNDATAIRSNINDFCETAIESFPHAEITWCLNSFSPLARTEWKTCLVLGDTIRNTSGNKFAFISLPHLMSIPAMYSHDSNDRSWQGFKIAGFHPSDWATPILEKLAINIFTGQNQVLYDSTGIDSELGATIVLEQAPDGTRDSTTYSYQSVNNYHLKLTQTGVSFQFTTDKNIPNNNYQYGYYSFLVAATDAPNLKMPFVLDTHSFAMTQNETTTCNWLEAALSVVDTSYLRTYTGSYWTLQPTSGTKDITLSIKA